MVYKELCKLKKTILWILTLHSDNQKAIQRNSLSCGKQFQVPDPESDSKNETKCPFLCLSNFQVEDPPGWLLNIFFPCFHTQLQKLASCDTCGTFSSPWVVVWFLSLVFRSSPSADFGLLACSQFISPWDIDNQMTFAMFANSFTGCCGHHHSLQTALGLELNSFALIVIWRYSLGLLFFCAQYRL